ncbi:hypothetical protein AA313_de0208784 [Arthrobotrys entomopaga]|nr:hypothetical protein AA313_de0208784 [Arthrobotrys entomopaga]
MQKKYLNSHTHPANLSASNTRTQFTTPVPIHQLYIRSPIIRTIVYLYYTMADSSNDAKQPGLLRLPVELFENVIQDLDLPSINNLRLSCKTLVEKSLQSFSKRYISNQYTDLSQESLHRLTVLSQHPIFGKAVKNLIIVAAIFDLSIAEGMLKTKTKTIRESRGAIHSVSYPQCTEQELADAQADVDWLRARQTERDQLGSDTVAASLAELLTAFGSLQGIYLRVDIVQGRRTPTGSRSPTQEWISIWKVAAQFFDISMIAIARSGVKLDSLSIYRETRGISVPTFTIQTLLHKVDLEAFKETGKHIKKFTINTSTRVPIDAASVREAAEQLEGANRAYHEVFGSSVGLYTKESPEAQAEENFTGLARLLSTMPNLTVLDIHMRDCLRNNGSELYEKVFRLIVQETYFPNLQEVGLRGLSMTEETLLEFLRKHGTALREIHLQSVTLTSGGWVPIFKQFEQMPVLDRLDLSNLWAKEIFNLYPVDESQGVDVSHRKRETRRYWVSCFGGTLVHTNMFTRGDIVKGLVFRDTPEGRTIGSPQQQYWFNMSSEFQAPYSF